MMRIKVVRPFPYSQDGLKVETLPVGWEGDVRDDISGGLIAAGYVSESHPVVEETAAAARPPKARKG